ncbi:MAG TPA: SCO family protein, partial [Puia sp.]|nr:SCO family protein [Puia sp.]
VQEMKAMEDSLSAAERRDVGFVLVSFDAERDDAAHLAQFAEQQGLDGRWVLLHGSPEQVRELSMLLEVRYKRLEDGNYTHSNVIVILDRNGGIEKTLPGLEPGKDSAVQIIGRLAAR